MMRPEKLTTIDPNEAIIHPNEVVEIVTSVFENMMGLETEKCGVPWFANHDRLTAVVHLTGDWNGAVLLECSRRQARRFAARFLSTSHDVGLDEGNPGGPVDDVTRDVLGEVANMIGGNLKCVLARGTRLSMPSVVDGDYGLRVCGAGAPERLSFESTEGCFWVAVLRMRT
jgi:chemotaxis protein CheX